jgi:hypothetical protein
MCSSSSGPSRGGSHSELARQSGEFMKIARSIGRDIANTYSKLEKLTLLARRKTIFDDRPAEIEELTHIIKEDMNALNRQIGQLQQVGQPLFTSNESKRSPYFLYKTYCTCKLFQVSNGKTRWPTID